MTTPQNGQTHPNNSSAAADELLECVWPFCGVSALKSKAMKKWNAWLHTNHAVLVKHLQSEAYSDTCQTSSIKLYAKIVNGWKPLPISEKKNPS